MCTDEKRKQYIMHGGKKEKIPYLADGGKETMCILWTEEKRKQYNTTGMKDSHIIWCHLKI